MRRSRCDGRISTWFGGPTVAAAYAKSGTSRTVSLNSANGNGAEPTSADQRFCFCQTERDALLCPTRLSRSMPTSWPDRRHTAYVTTHVRDTAGRKRGGSQNGAGVRWLGHAFIDSAVCARPSDQKGRGRRRTGEEFPISFHNSGKSANRSNRVTI